MGRVVAQNNINLSILRNFEVPIPDLPMQKQIVAILDKTAKVVEVRQQQLQQLDELVKARFVAHFSYSNYTIKLVNNSTATLDYMRKVRTVFCPDFLAQL